MVETHSSSSVELEILLVDGDPALLRTWTAALRRHGHRATAAADAASACSIAAVRCFDAIVCDPRVTDASGVRALDRLRILQPACNVILVSELATVTDAVAAMKEPVFEVLRKPFACEELLDAIAALGLEQRREREAVRSGLAELVGRTPAMVKLRRTIAAVARSGAPVLITGETGTGKELVAQRIHASSTRADRPFVAVNCGALPDSLVESELFGHEAGAFTGALQRRDGMFRYADGGTLFLDELGEMTVCAQAKLLRVLDHGCYEPLGSSATMRVDVRIVSATNADVQAAVRAGRLRADLLHRIKVFHLQLPPLRERRADLPLLTAHLLRRLQGGGMPLPELTRAAWECLERHRFPGNVRELKHAMEHALVLSRGKTIDIEHLPPELVAEAEAAPASTPPLAEATQAFERAYLLGALEQCGWRKLACARELGISRKTLWEKMRQHGIDPPARGGEARP